MDLIMDFDIFFVCGMANSRFCTYCSVDSVIESSLREIIERKILLLLI